MKAQSSYAAILVVLIIILLVPSTLPLKIVANASPIVAAENSWTTMAPMPTARAQFGVAVVDGKIYAIGGANNSASGPNVLSVNEEYDPAKNSWTTKAPMPTARHSFGIAVYQNKIYCIGGSINGPHLTVNEVYDPATDIWETKTPMPTARAGLCANTVDGIIYLMGGEPANTTNEAYDPVTDSWSTRAQVSEGIVYSPSAAVEDKIYLFGSLSNPNSNQIYDPETDTWTFGSALPDGVSEGAAAATSGANAPVRIYVMGGQTTYVSNGYAFANFSDLNQVYNPDSNTWSKATPIPTELRLFGLAAANDTFYAIGGFPGVMQFLDSNYQYTPIAFNKAEQSPAIFADSWTDIVVISSAIISTGVATFTVHFIRKHKRALKPAIK